MDVRQHCANVDNLETTHLLELEARPLVGHPLVPRAEFALWGTRGRVDILWRICCGSQRLFAVENGRGVRGTMGGS